MKRISYLTAIIVLLLCCISFTSCTLPTKELEKELERQKLVLSSELENLSHFDNGGRVLATYRNHTYATIEDIGDGGHCFYGKVYFKDKYGTTYFANYVALVENESWYPEISISEIRPLNNQEIFE